MGAFHGFLLRRLLGVGYPAAEGPKPRGQPLQTAVASTSGKGAGAIVEIGVNVT